MFSINRKVYFTTLIAVLFAILMLFAAVPQQADAETPKGGHSDCASGHSGWTAMTASTGEISQSGNYYLTADTTLNAPVIINGDGITVNLCLNGHFMVGTNGDSGSVIEVRAGTLNLYDCNGANGNQYYKLGADGKYEFGSGSEYTRVLSGGLITGGTNVNGSTYGGGIGVRYFGFLNIYGGTIAGNSAQNGGGVSIDGERFNMYGGTICGNTANFGGGGIFIGYSVESVTIFNGDINANKAVEGGGIQTGAKALDIKGGRIFANTADFGGGVEIYGGCTVSGGKITGNNCEKKGGGLLVAEKEGKQISLTISGDADITGNTLKGELPDSFSYVGDADNICLQGAQKIIIGQDGFAGKTGVTMENIGVATSNWGSSTGTLASDKTGYGIKTENGEYVIYKLAGSGLSLGALIGIIVGSILLLLLAVYFAVYFVLYRKHKLDDSSIKVIYSFLPQEEKKEEENKS